MQPWRTPFPNLEPVYRTMFNSNCCSWPAHRFLRRQVRWSGIHISWRIFHSLLWVQAVKGFGIINKAEIDVFLELSCFFDDPMDVSNLISGSSAFSKSSLNIWNFMVHVQLKLDLENFEHYFANRWDECNWLVVWEFFGIAFLWDWNENWLFPVLWPLCVFQICWHIETSTFTASSFRIWNSSTWIPSPPLALFILMLPKAHLISTLQDVWL